MIIPPGYANVKMRFALAGDPDEHITTFGLRLNAGINDPVAIATEMVSDWEANWILAGLSDQYTLVGATVQVGNDGGEYPTGDFVADDAGTWNATPPPSNTALLVRKRSLLGGRRNRGRMYLPAGYLSEITIDPRGVLDAGLQAVFQARADAWQAAVEGSTSADSLVIFHSEAPTTPTLVTSLSVDNLVATQRRRMRR